MPSIYDDDRILDQLQTALDHADTPDLRTSIENAIKARKKVIRQRQ